MLWAYHLMPVGLCTKWRLKILTNYTCLLLSFVLMRPYYTQIAKEFEGKEDGETIVQIFQICFPIITRKNIEQSQPEPLNEPERQLYGHDKILAEHHMSETEAWAELNRMFKEQENQRKNHE